MKSRQTNGDGVTSRLVRGGCDEQTNVGVTSRLASIV